MRVLVRLHLIADVNPRCTTSLSTREALPPSPKASGLLVQLRCAQDLLRLLQPGEHRRVRAARDAMAERCPHSSPEGVR